MKFRPLHDRVLVRRVDEDTKTKGGIIIPDSAQEKPLRGTVLAVGPGKTLDSGKRADTGISVGDEVLYGRYHGTEVNVGGKDYIIINAEDILAIVSGEAKPAKALVGAGATKAKAGAKK